LDREISGFGAVKNPLGKTSELSACSEGTRAVVQQTAPLGGAGFARQHRQVVLKGQPGDGITVLAEERSLCQHEGTRRRSHSILEGLFELAAIGDMDRVEGDT